MSVFTQDHINRAASAALAYPALMMEYEYTDLALRDPLCDRFIRRLVYNDLIPGMQLQGDPATIIDRAIKALREGPEKIARLTLNGSDVMRDVFSPVSVNLLKEGRSPQYCAFMIAVWFRCMMGYTHRLKPLEVEEPHQRAIYTRISVGNHSKGGLIEDIFDFKLYMSDNFQALLEKQHRNIFENGTREAMGILLNGPKPRLANTPG